MLFNSIEFIFLFLPITLFSFIFCSKFVGREAGIALLVICSLFFYSWWNPIYLLLLIFSMCLNFNLGKKLGAKPSRKLLFFGVFTNLALIIYYKYTNFIIFNINTITSSHWEISTIILPLAISFFTFQQIAYLVDSHRGITKEYNFIHYSLFVSFFPQLIAGPIVHHKDMLPQFNKPKPYRLNALDLSIGISIFSLGFFKKTVIADGIAVYATPIFKSADAGATLTFFEAWGGALAYTFQLYFDFSGYSDMAIGIARMFGIILPLNFYSPYKSLNITEFWRRWHITLSRFLRDYVYIAWGGNRHGQLIRYRNLFATMLLGGLWHGAGWNFIIWGGLHASYLSINHVWQICAGKLFTKNVPLPFTKTFSWLLTFLCVVIGWVFFRAETYHGATSLLESMAGMHGISLPNAIMARLGDSGEYLRAWGVASKIGDGMIFISTWIWIIFTLFVCVFLPNSQDLFSKFEPSISEDKFTTNQSYWPMYKISKAISWQPTRGWAFIIASSLSISLLTLSQVSEFLYFQF